MSGHRRIAPWTAFAAVLLVLAGVARAEDDLLERLSNPKVAYSADLSLVSGPANMTGRIFHAPGLTRTEMVVQGQRMVSIIDLPGQRATIVMPGGRHMVVRLPGQSVSAYLPPGVTRDQVKLQMLGRESVDGMSTRKVRYSFPSGGAVLWVTDDNITVKVDGHALVAGQKSKIKMRLSNLKRGPQDPMLFRVPAGSRELKPGGR